MIKLWKENQYKHLFLITLFGFMFAFVSFWIDRSIGYAFERFLFFTVQSNFLVVMYFLFNNTKVMEKLRLPITMLITTTFITFNGFIWPFGYSYRLGDFQWWWHVESFLNHVVNPLIMIIAYWVDDRKKESVLSNYVVTMYGFIYIPLLWIFQSNGIGFIPYTFFDFQAHGWILVIAAAIAMILMFNAMSYAFRKKSDEISTEPKPMHEPWVWFTRKEPKKWYQVFSRKNYISPRGKAKEKLQNKKKAAKKALKNPVKKAPNKVVKKPVKKPVKKAVKKPVKKKK